MSGLSKGYRTEWVQLQFEEASNVQEIYGFSSTKGVITVEGVHYVPERPISNTLLIYMHPAATQTVLPIPKAVAAAGFPVLVAGSRYTRNDTSLIMEKILRDLGAYVEHARTVWNYDKVVLAGWSGGGSLALFYQAQAEKPTITMTPAGDPLDVAAFGLIPADAVIFQAAHLSRASLLADMIDPSVIAEDDPDRRSVELDIYDPRNPSQPPYHAEFLATYRQAQRARMARRTAFVKDMLEQLRRRPGPETERGLLTHRTMADPRYLDPTIDPNDREPGTTFLGDPETVNSAMLGFARFSSLRSWLSQWSPDDTNTHADVNARAISVPLLCIRNTADNAVLGPQVERVYEAAGSARKHYVEILGANHYYAGQPELLAQSIDEYRGWMETEGLL